MSQRHIRVFVRVYKTGSIKEMTYPINAVIFDIDGVLLDSLYLEGAWKKIYCKTWIYTCSGYG